MLTTNNVIEGYDLRTVQMVTRSQCMYLCERDNQCKGVEHELTSGDCVLKGSNSGLDAKLVDANGWDLYETFCQGTFILWVYMGNNDTIYSTTSGHMLVVLGRSFNMLMFFTK